MRNTKDLEEYEKSSVWQTSLFRGDHAGKWSRLNEDDWIGSLDFEEDNNNNSTLRKNFMDTSKITFCLN